MWKTMAEDLSRLEFFLSSKPDSDPVKQYKVALGQLVEVPAARAACFSLLSSAAFDLLHEEESKVFHSLVTDDFNTTILWDLLEHW